MFGMFNRFWFASLEGSDQLRNGSREEHSKESGDGSAKQERQMLSPQKAVLV